MELTETSTQVGYRISYPQASYRFWVQATHRYPGYQRRASAAAAETTEKIGLLVLTAPDRLRLRREPTCLPACQRRGARGRGCQLTGLRSSRRRSRIILCTNRLTVSEAAITRNFTRLTRPRSAVVVLVDSSHGHRLRGSRTKIQQCYE